MQLIGEVLQDGHHVLFCCIFLFESLCWSFWICHCDRSWQGELSWQFDTTGWRDNRDLSAALSPWTATDASFTSAANDSRIFRRSANDYYLSRRTDGVFQNFINPSYDHSYSGLQPSGRLELQSFDSRANENSYTSRSHVSREHKGKPRKSPRLTTITEGTSAGKSGPLAVKDELQSIDYDRIEDVESHFQVDRWDTDPCHQQTVKLRDHVV